ncbi:oxidoreductase-like protein [Glonium stellatum]|uniref:Oxidoreductase-like protein n=1 Tax=Glonium stellatum TaxID=574774 RepID=A0A8E2F6I3_9PEZI|nr:oxidoreductase-like protein [Glonium stellatum]
MFGGKSFDTSKDIPDLSGKVILVTGGNAGLGQETILRLASRNPSKIYLAARTASKAQAAIKEIKKTVPNAPIEHLPLDLASFASIRSAAETFTSESSRLDLLVNNAGVMGTPYGLTKDGYEDQFGTNVMGHALLTRLLLPTLLKTAEEPNSDVRVVNLASIGHHMAPSGGVIFDQAALENYSTWRRYGQAKLSNILFARELARRYPTIKSVAVHPGIIMTNLYTPMQSNILSTFAVWLTRTMAPLLPGVMTSTEEGATNSLWAATAPADKVKSGQYYTPIAHASSGSRYAHDDGLAKKLWEYIDTELQKHGF